MAELVVNEMDLAGDSTAAIGNTGTNDYLCIICNKTFDRVKDLDIHLKDKHVPYEGEIILIKQPTGQLRLFYYIEDSQGETEIQHPLTDKQIRSADYVDEIIDTVPISGFSPSGSTDYKNSVFPISQSPNDLYKFMGHHGNAECIVRLLTGMQITATSLDAYMHMISKETNPRYAFLPSCFLPIFHNCRNPMTAFANRTLIPELTSIITVIAPMLCLEHFYLAIIKIREKQVEVYDSSWGSLKEDMRRDQVARCVKELFPSDVSKWNMICKMHCTKQKDKTSCGAYVVHFAENYFARKYGALLGKLDKDQVLAIRQKMAVKLLNTTQDGKSLLKALIK